MAVGHFELSENFMLFAPLGLNVHSPFARREASRRAVEREGHVGARSGESEEATAFGGASRLRIATGTFLVVHR